MPRRIVSLHRWQIGLAFLAITAAFVVQGIFLELTIRDVQHSRRLSCERTYESFREVFRPFFRPPAQRTPKENRDLKTFNDTVNRLRARCSHQVKAGGGA